MNISAKAKLFDNQRGFSFHRIVLYRDTKMHSIVRVFMFMFMFMFSKNVKTSILVILVSGKGPKSEPPWIKNS